jgi:hypothetical protein
VQVFNAGEVFRFGHRAVEDSDVMAMAHGLLHEGAPCKPGAANHKKLHPNPPTTVTRAPDAGPARALPGFVPEDSATPGCIISLRTAASVLTIHPRYNGEGDPVRKDRSITVMKPVSPITAP